MASHERIAHASEQVGYGILHGHDAFSYQLDLITPGISPLSAISRKQMRQMPNLRMKALGRPQMGQRL